MKFGKLKALVATDLRRVSLVATVASLVVMAAAVGSPNAAGVFAPTISLETSTSRASAHPDARVVIDNTDSDTNIKDLKLSLPDGFWGSIGAVPLKCPASDAELGNCGTTTPESKLGTVTATARIEDGDTTVDGVLSGNVYMTGDLETDADPSNDNDPAGVSIVVDAKVGGVDLGRVKINGRAAARMVAPTNVVGVAKEVRGLDAIVEGIPQTITDTNARTVSYKINKMQIDLISELQNPSDPDPIFGYMPPLLTNPSRCGTHQISALATPYGGGADAPITDDFVVDQCDTARFDPTATTTFTDTPIPAGSAQSVYASIAFPAATNQPESNSSFDALELLFPRGMGANFDAFGSAAQMCPGSSIGTVSDVSSPNFGHNYFIPGSCPAASIIGNAYITTPLLAPGQQLQGIVYSINTTPVPSLAIAATDDIGGNPKGINIYLTGKADLVSTDTACVVGCDKRIIMKFIHLPDTPVTAVDVLIDPGEGRAGTSLSGKVISQASNGAANCQSYNDLRTKMTASAGGSRSSVQSYDTTCTGNTITPTTGSWGQVITDDTPTFDLTYSGAAASLWCGIDTIISGATDCKPSLTYEASTVSEGAHSILVGDGSTALGGRSLVRDFVVQPTLTYGEVVPTTSLSAGPGAPGPGVGTTDDSTPSFTFSASETSSFQCSLDDGAFLPCGSATGTASDTYAVPVDEYLEASDTTHTFEVRAQDADGNVDLTPARASFKVEKLFDPQNSVSLTTNVARAHPELTMTITNDSHEGIKDLHLDLPDGFFGGLTGVAALCTIANADAGTCGAGSEVGTVDATAIIDRSTAKIKGKVFLTDPRTLGDPAGLTIEVKPKIQDVTFVPIRINARLMVRGDAQGINTAALNIPNTTTSTLNEVSSFDIRTMVIKLNNNNAAPQKLLTNPSACGNGPFKTRFDGHGPSSSTDTPSVNFIGCENLSFGPALAISQVERSTGGPPGPSTNIKRATVDMTVSLNADPNRAGIRSVNLTMPEPVTIDVQRIPPPCIVPEVSPRSCPDSSAIGTATATTPLLAEPVTGKVHVLKSQTSLPRLLIALRGRINVDLVAVNSYTGTKFNRIQTDLNTLPDVPLTSFGMNINGFLTTRDDSCDSGPEAWSVVGLMNAHNGSAAAVNIPLNFDCPNATTSIFKSSWKPRGAKSTLTIDVTPQGSRQLKKATVKLPKGVKFVKSAFSKKKIGKKVTVTAGGKKLSTKCFKLKNTTTFEVGFCKKLAADVVIKFKAGSITTRSKSKKLKFKVITVDSAGKTQTAKRVNQPSP
ncbi:MAG: hypothetical protein ACSLFF_05065 [Solirubrobacterales bacterium]